MTEFEQVSGLVRKLYEIVRELEKLPGAGDRRFTPDGHLVGSLGEVIAAYEYDLDLLPNSHPVHDAVSRDGRNLQVQIKLTQGTRVGLREEPEHLIVLYLDPSTGKHREVYNGPGAAVWNIAGTLASNGQRAVSLSRLRKEQEKIPLKDRLSAVRCG